MIKKFILKSWPRILKYVLGPLLLVILFWTIGIKQVWLLLTAADLRYFILAYFFFTLVTLIGAFKLYLLFFPLREIEPRKFLQYFFASRIMTLIFPGRFGEFSLSYYLHEEDINLGRGLAAVVTDKLISVSCSMILALIAVYIFMEGQQITIVAIYIVVMLALFTMMLSTRCRNFIKKWILRKYAHHFAGFSKTLISYERENKGLALLNMIFTLVQIVVSALSAKMIFLSLGTHISLFTLILVSGLETLSNSIPITVNGIGVKQAIGIYVFSAIGVSPVITGARYLIGFLIEYSFGFFSTLFIKNDLFMGKEKMEKLD
ncbi:MAG TPA: lysylphosphatidylglycerol synthase transmembrane domain-containing protein [Candidatus Nanoarchaeia archaeon]|nr:lysylphosphatidylglycerol synthase transmembrane domain-containing protein [Candidatus Nanoarchaeia archaeon]